MHFQGLHKGLVTKKNNIVTGGYFPIKKPLLMQGGSITGSIPEGSNRLVGTITNGGGISSHAIVRGYGLEDLNFRLPPPPPLAKRDRENIKFIF